MHRSHSATVIDVRTPAEFEHGHIPGALNVPIFSNEERAVIGTLYKNEGKYPAILKGLDFTAPRLSAMMRTLHKNARNNQLLVHCWRGGMRSASMAWLAHLAGIEVYTLQDGYKSYRRHVLKTLEQPMQLQVLGGYTGSGKTQVLENLQAMGQQVIHLEKLAHHKGSAYGHINEPHPPTQEYFENRLAQVIAGFNLQQPVWIEDESRLIGRIVIPETLFNTLRSAPVFFMDISKALRAQYLSDEYGKFSTSELIAATHKIEKRLGPELCRQTIACIESGNMTTACEMLLDYYDKTYLFGLQKRNGNQIFKLSFTEMKFKTMAEYLLQVSLQPEK